MKTTGTQVLMQAGGEKEAQKLLSGALLGENRPFRNAVIREATALFGAKALVPLMTKKFPNLGDDSKIDVINWLGNNRIAEATDLIIGQIGAGGDIAPSAIAAAGKIGGEKEIGRAHV